MSDAPEKWDSMTRKQLMLTATEYRSERDAAKSDTLRAFDERNILQAENARLTSEVARLRTLLREALLHLEGAKMSVCAMSEGRLKATIRDLLAAESPK